MTTRRWLLALLLGLLALAGHIAYHYLPRARPGVPDGESQVAALLDATDFPASVWVPYPHQNLAHLRQAVGVESESMRAIARLAGLPSPTLPTFGPLSLPPSSEIAIASDELGERFVVVAQVYPAIAAFARLAGRLAGNPWLCGGEIVVEGRPAEVRWEGNRWMVASSEQALAAAPERQVPAEVAPASPGLVWIRIRQAVDPLPAGLYRLWENAGDLGITSDQTAPAGSSAPQGTELAASELAVSKLASRLETFGMFLLVYSGRLPALGEPAQALAFFDQEDEKVMEMPRVASLHEPGAERWKLPGESLVEIAGHRPLTAAADGWSIAAFDAASVDGAGRVAPELNAVAHRHLRWGLWLDFRGGMAEVERIARVLGELPFVPRRQVERWTDVRRALSPLAEHYTGLTATVTDEPRAFDLRLKAAAAQ